MQNPTTLKLSELKRGKKVNFYAPKTTEVNTRGGSNNYGHKLDDIFQQR